MPHFGRTRSPSQVVTPVVTVSITVVPPSRTAQCTQPSGAAPMPIANSMSIQWFCSGTRSTEPTSLLVAKTRSSNVCFPPVRRSDCTTIGSLPVPGIFICMMWQNVVVALSVSGMNSE